MVFDREETRHLARVLRLRPGDVVVAAAGTGVDYTVRIETLGPTAAGTILGVAAPRAESPLALTLVQGIPKGDKMEAIVRAATELGVRWVWPAIAERTVVKLEPGRWRERARRWQRVAKEAAKQCGRALPPEVASPLSLVDCLAAAASVDLKICLWEKEPGPLGPLLITPGAPATAAVIIGPEGGLTQTEVDAARAHGYAIAGLGPRILRTETAGLAIIAILQSRFGDLGATGGGC